jgi:hypothetical protein
MLTKLNSLSKICVFLVLGSDFLFLRSTDGFRLFCVMLELDKVECAHFAEFVDQDFEIALKGAAALNVRLVEVRSLGPARTGSREPFVLVFRAEASVRLPQHIYAVSHARLGTMEIFLVQIGADSTGAYFEAVFN